MNDNPLIIDFTCNIQEITEAVKYVINDGKKIRANIIYSLGNQSELSVIFAHMIEFLHNASLILDDLPCMDNSDIRRNTKGGLERTASMGFRIKLVYFLTVISGPGIDSDLIPCLNE